MSDATPLPKLKPLLEEELGGKVVKLWKTRESAVGGEPRAIAAFVAAGISCEQLVSIASCQELVYQLAQASTERVSNRISGTQSLPMGGAQ